MGKSFLKSLILNFLVLNLSSSPVMALEGLENTLISAQNLILAEQEADGVWDYPAYLGSFYVSQYLIMKEWLNLPPNPAQIQSQREHLIASRQYNGSWLSVEDTLAREGDLNATVWNYLFLKKFPDSSTDSFLPTSLQWILKHGGAEAANMLSRIMLSCLDLYPWSRVVPIPEMVINETNPVLNLTNFAQWVGPHLKPISILRRNQVKRKIFEASEIFRRHPGISPAVTPPSVRKRSQEAAKTRALLLPVQQPHGSWGGYTLSTLFSIMALQSAGEDLQSPPIQRGLEFIETRFFNNGQGNNRGSLQDGRYWDTVLIGRALIESGLEPQRLKTAADRVIEAQTKEGGLPFGFDFEYAPDVDDTAEMILFLKHFDSADENAKGSFENPYSDNIRRAEEFIFKMQNRDGGWGAFAKDNVPLPWIQPFLLPFKDSVDFFDESSTDVTAHALEALGRLGYTVHNSLAVQKAVQYLKKQQEPKTGGWLARWGVNYIYGTGAVLVGLAAVGEDLKAPYAQRATDWLKHVQNPEHGGYGETALSYKNIHYAGVGDATASQTAWALSGLIAAGEAHSVNAQKAAAFLVNEMQTTGDWRDPSTTGTGHPGIISMNYPSYPYAFSLIALSAFSKALATTNH